MTNRYQILSVGKYVEDQLRLRMLSTLRVSPATGYIKASILACVRCYYRCLPATRFRRIGMATLNTSRLYQGSSISVWEKSLEIQKAVQCLGFLLASKNRHHETRRGPTISWISGCRWCLYNARVPRLRFGINCK